MAEIWMDENNSSQQMTTTSTTTMSKRIRRTSKVFTQSSFLGCASSIARLSEEDLEWIVNNTDRSREQVEEQFQSFLQKHPDGKISKKDFMSMMKESHPCCCCCHRNCRHPCNRARRTYF